MTRRPSLRALRAFTLLEVMVAIAVLALGVTVLLQVQARSIYMAQQARALTVATQLARSKLYDCEDDLLKKGFSVGDYKEDGKFDEEGYDSFYWECRGYEPDLPVPTAADISEGMASDALGKLTGSSDLGAAAQGNPMMGMAGGMLGPAISTLADVMKKSIRELVVIVRWKDGEDWEELSVTTHIVDTTAVNAIAGAASQGIPGLPNFGGGGGGGGGGSKSPSPSPGGPGGQPPIQMNPLGGR